MAKTIKFTSSGGIQAEGEVNAPTLYAQNYIYADHADIDGDSNINGTLEVEALVTNGTSGIGINQGSLTVTTTYYLPTTQSGQMGFVEITSSRKFYIYTPNVSGSTWIVMVMPSTTYNPGGSGDQSTHYFYKPYTSNGFISKPIPGNTHFMCNDEDDIVIWYWRFT